MKTNMLICHHCCKSNCVRKNGQSATGNQRFYCTSCKKTFQVKYIYHASEAKIQRQIYTMLENGKSNQEISNALGVSLRLIERHVNVIALAESLGIEETQ